EPSANRHSKSGRPDRARLKKPAKFPTDEALFLRLQSFCLCPTETDGENLAYAASTPQSPQLFGEHAGMAVIPGRAKHEPQMSDCTSGNLPWLRRSPRR